MRALLLNADYTPVAVVTARRAVCAVMSGKAELVAPSDRVFHSANGTAVVVPAVIRLVKYVKVPFARSVVLTRRTVLARDKHLCGYCRKTADTIDHIHPRARGGLHVWENVTAACGPCNRKKGQKRLEDLGWINHNPPFRPKGIGAWLLNLKHYDPAWEPFLGIDTTAKQETA